MGLLTSNKHSKETSLKKILSLQSICLVLAISAKKGVSTKCKFQLPALGCVGNGILGSGFKRKL